MAKDRCVATNCENAFDQTCRVQAAQSKKIKVLGEPEDWMFNEDGNLW